MKSNLKIKVCGIADQEFIEQADSLNIDFIGFIFYTQSKRYLMNNLYNNYIKALPESIKKVGVFVNVTQAQIEKTVNAYNLDLIQLHGDEDLDYVKEISKKFNVIKVFRIDEEFDFQQIGNYEKYCNYFLFDTRGIHYGGTEKKFNWQLLENYNGNLPFLLSGGISPVDINSILNFQHSKLAGIDINSGFEIKPGIKDIEKIKTFINQIK